MAKFHKFMLYCVLILAFILQSLMNLLQDMTHIELYKKKFKQGIDECVKDTNIIKILVC